jgi:hypothetical protein
VNYEARDFSIISVGGVRWSRRLWQVGDSTLKSILGRVAWHNIVRPVRGAELNDGWVDICGAIGSVGTIVLYGRTDRRSVPELKHQVVQSFDVHLRGVRTRGILPEVQGRVAVNIKGEKVQHDHEY